MVIEKVNCHRPADGCSGQIKLNISMHTTARVISMEKAYGYLEIKIGTHDSKDMFKLDVLLRAECSPRLGDGQEGLTEQQLKEFCEVQSLPLLLPWARHIVSDITTRMGLTPLMLPIISVMDTLTDLQFEDAEDE